MNIIKRIAANTCYSFFLATALCATLSAQTVQPNGTVIPPTDKNIIYVGRYDKSNPAAYHGNWIGSYIRTKFTGTSVSIILGQYSGLDVSIDQEPIRVVMGGAGTVRLNITPLSPGVHHLIVGVKGGGGWDFDGLVLDPGAHTQPADHRPILEAIGDSITSGCGGGSIEAAGNYNCLAADALNMDHTQMSWPGRALSTGYGCDGHDKNGLNTQYFLQNDFYDHPQGPWDFSTYAPRIIIINLGQNDGCGNEPDDAFVASYVKFLTDIRAKFPAAQIVALRMFGGGNYGADTKVAVDQVYSNGDHKVHYIDTNGWLQKSDFVDGIHPNPEGNVKVAQKLIPLLQPLTHTSLKSSIPEYLNTPTGN